MNFTIVPVKFTLDTNILIYAADRSDLTGKRERALHLLTAAIRSGQALPLQVLNEFCHAVTRKRLLATGDLEVIMAEHAQVFRLIAATAEDTMNALRLHSRTGYSFWDSLLLVTSLRAGCSIFFSEDMQDGFTVDGLVIVNPFRHPAVDLELLLQTGRS